MEIQEQHKMMCFKFLTFQLRLSLWKQVLKCLLHYQQT